MQQVAQEKCSDLITGDYRDNKQSSRGGRKEKRSAKNAVNSLQAGIRDFIAQLPPSTYQDHGQDFETLASSLPKRFTIYEPMLLLPVNAFKVPPAWGALYASLDDGQRHALYELIVRPFRKMGVTHLAVNAPIALRDIHGNENRMRSPVGLVPLYGDFGPLPSGNGEDVQPIDSDFQKAFWVRTVQNHGINQTWAPLYTMFSRGNITEKIRILGHGARFDGLDSSSLGEDVGDISIVDMYAGIGYFVFSYLRRGVKRVWGWEINGWSVEGLRRGCKENGWGCKVVRIGQYGDLDVAIPDLVESLTDTDRAVIFHGDNKFASEILHEIKTTMERKGRWNRVRHVNLGLLPTSRPAWEGASRAVDLQKGGWVHVHENVDIRELDRKKEDIVSELKRLRIEAHQDQFPRIAGVAECRHIEQVKTYAPGIMHCVFDVELS